MKELRRGDQDEGVLKHIDGASVVDPRCLNAAPDQLFTSMRIRILVKLFRHQKLNFYMKI
jgi:hypothetical protein